MQPLEKTLRKKLEDTVKEARDTAELAARAILGQLGVGEATPFYYLTDPERELRRKLRAHGRQLGDLRNDKTETQEIDRLIEEVAYEHWHRMLFARFLAENNLLMYPDPDDPVAVTLEECEDLAADEGAKNGWELASRYAAKMLPQIFRPDSPVFQLELPPERQQKLEKLVAELPQEVFTASDSLGWVYQFWQAKKKDEVNASEVKIGARELPAVTQLFTEPYMVAFLLDNSLGAWWAARKLTKADLRDAESEDELRNKAALPGMPLEYLRFVKVEAASSRFALGEDAPSQFSTQVGYFHKEDPVANMAGNLPHWRQEGVTYFLTFRTADSLPQEKLKLWQREKETWLASHPEPHDEETRREFYELFPDRLQRWLDNGYGECPLADGRYRTIVEDALRHFDGKRYHLNQYVVMPNHVHVLVSPLGEYGLSDILHSWKSFTANQINKLTGRDGAFWQKESFDHIVRSPAQLERIREYIRKHPAYGYGYDKKRQDAASTMWAPAAGIFEGWPDRLSEFKTLDPCCGSGHFLVAALLMLVPIRMEMEGLPAREAVDAVLCDNLHGLEIDQRCVELAAFALALTAWRYPEAGGYRKLPELNLACTGLSVSVAKEEWKQLALNKHNLRIALDWMYDVFKDAPVLGSLLNPAKTDAAKIVPWDELAETIAKGLEKQNGDEERREAGVVAHGLAKAATLLSDKYHWVITNVPYLARGKQNEVLRDFCEKEYPAAKNDIATVFLDRCLEFCESGRGLQPLKSAPGCHKHSGTVSIVLPQNWLFLTSYKKFRERLLKQDSWHLIARLGPSAFETISGEVVKAILITMSRGNQAQDGARSISGLDVSDLRTVLEKATQLIYSEIKKVDQRSQLANPDARVAFNGASGSILLEKYASALAGINTGDYPRWGRTFWEITDRSNDWVFQQTTTLQTSYYAGLTQIFKWCGGAGEYFDYVEELNGRLGGSWKRGVDVWGKQGVSVSQMGNLPVSLYSGTAFDSNVSVIVPYNQEHVAAIHVFCSSEDFALQIRRIDQKLNVTNATLAKVPFDLDHWTQIAQEKYPNGLPKSYSDDPTHWIFHGHPVQSNEPLQVAVARLLGYRWPSEVDNSIELSDEAHAWIKESESLLQHADKDGIVCIPPVRGETAATDRLINLLAVAYSDAWNSDKLSELLKKADHTGKSLDTWLRDKFFTQHCNLYHHRPFIWHIWDGLRDGFAALVNYHKLDRKNLETLIYTYLGDWITRQKQDKANGVDGAEEKLAAAENLKKRLELILEGESPYDIFVRWKTIEKQPIGWEPDLNDGVRLNIRPFLSVPDVGKRGAGVLRDKPNINWNKDRGKDVPSAPWYHLFNGDRINDHHLSLAEKHAARAEKEA
ncbi:MAG: transposase [Syntrophobacteraceae bacterium]